MRKQEDLADEFLAAVNEVVCQGCKDKTDDCCCDKWKEKANEIARMYAIETGQITIETLLKM